MQRKLASKDEAEQALRSSEERVRLLLDSTAEAIYGLDEQGRCTFCNPACIELLGYDSPEDLIGENMHELIHHSHRDGSPYLERECQIYRAFRKGEGVHVTDEVLWRKDGSCFPAEYRSHPISQNGRVLGSVVTFTDITDRVEARAALEERNRVLETIFSINLSVAAQLDLDKLVQQVTDAGTELTGAEFGAFFYNVEKPDGGSYMLYSLSGVPREKFSRFPMPRATQLFGPTFRGEGVIRLDDVTRDRRYGKNPPHRGMPRGHLPVRSYLAVPVVGRSDEVIGGLFFGHSEPGCFEPAHEKLVVGIAAQAAVAIDNARLYERAQHGKEMAEQANQRKDEFLALLSHELRNPLAPIRNAAAMLRLRGEDPRTVERARDILERQTTHITNLVDDLLDASRIDRGKINLSFTTLDLVDVVRRVAEDHRPDFEAVGVELELELARAPLWVEADSTRLTQIFGNVLDNARKFSRRGDRVRIEMEPSASGTAVSVKVRDTGLGMDPETLDRVFESFTQGSQSLDRQQGGLGLGMFVAQELVRRHQGTIAAWSDGPGQGSVFTVTLPLDEKKPREVPTESRDSSFEPLKLLVIDDNRDSADSLCELLALRGHETRATYDGVAGIEEARRFSPEVILCDVGLPGMDGYEVAEAIRGDETLRDVRLIAITGYGREEDRRRAHEAGFDRHLVKPVAIDELQRILAEAS